MKLFGSTGGARLAKNRTAILAGSTSVQYRGSAAAAAAVPTPKKRNPLKILAIILAVILALELCWSRTHRQIFRPLWCWISELLPASEYPFRPGYT